MDKLTDQQKSFLVPNLPYHDIEHTTSDTSQHLPAEPPGPEQSDKNGTEGSDQQTNEIISCRGRPFVTLTYAASLDSMIAIARGARTILSGPESKSMTHFLRMHHDAILVGWRTAQVDDPSLNCRYLGANFAQQPQPIVLDTLRRWKPETSKVLRLFREGQGKEPIVLCAPQQSGKQEHCQVVPVLGRTGESGKLGDDISTRLQWQDILETLYEQGIRSVMIEGGARIINGLLLQPWLVDIVIVTIAPTFLGNTGIQVSPDAQSDDRQHPINAAHIEGPQWQQFGKDMVLCGRLKADMRAQLPPGTSVGIQTLRR